MGQKKFWGKRTYRSEKCLGFEENVEPKKIGSLKRILVPKDLKKILGLKEIRGLQNVLGQKKNCGSETKFLIRKIRLGLKKTVWSKNIVGPKLCGSKKIGAQKYFGSEKNFLAENKIF